MITNAGASRTLTPAHRSLVTVVGIHDNKISDADVNLIQSLQDSKRQRLLKNQVSSGALSYTPFTYTAGTSSATALNFTVPAFDVLVNGEVVTIGGNLSASFTSNTVQVPSPIFYSAGSSNPACSLYVVFIEFWYQRLNPTTGMGYSKNSTTGALSFYPNGCVNALAANLIANDTIDPFMGIKTTERTQLQWAIRVQSIDPGYDFEQYSYGLDPGATTAQTVWGQANQTTLTTASPYQFTNLGPINGDTGLWRSGDGNLQNALSTCDGYSYALPLAIVFQRNTGVFAVANNPFGTASASISPSGLLASGVTARYDGKFADVVFPNDVVDTRSVISLAGWDQEEVLKQGFSDIISGNTRIALARGEVPGSLPTAAGSLLDYVVTVAPSATANSENIGSWDGYCNGFSSADTTFYTSQAVTVDQKTTGSIGSSWVMGDSFSVSLPASSLATIEYVQAQGLVTNSLQGTMTPVLYLSGQITVTGLGTKTVTVSFAKDLTGTSYDPGLNPIYVTLGVEYPANGGMDLVQTPVAVAGGSLTDAATGLTLPVYGISDYEVQTSIPAFTSLAAFAYNPGYSNLIFGTRIQTTILASTGTTTTNTSGNTVTSFTVNRQSLNGSLTGIYVLSATDQTLGTTYTISSRSISGMNFIFQITGTVPTTSTLILTFLAANTAQLSYNAPVKAVTTIEETVIAGNIQDVNFRPDPRISVVSVQNFPGSYNSVVLATTGGVLTGISGDDVNKIIWVKDTSGNYDAVQISSAIFANSFVTLTVPPTVNLTVQNFFVVAALNPAFAPASSLTLLESYVPYQGEGRTLRDYEVVHTEETALATTNGTGIAPVPGLRDIYPYNRELPIVTMLPSQATWSDATLLNQPVASFFDSNYVAKEFENIEHTFEVPVHTNDFIQPLYGDTRKTFQLSTVSGGRGYAKAIPHMGFAIQPLTPKTVAAQGVNSTTASVTLYVNNVSGNDANDGLTTTTAYQSIGAALAALPSVLQSPCSIQLVPTGTSYELSSINNLQVVALGDGVIRQAYYYCLGSLCYTIQGSGRLVITALAGTTGYVTIDATGYAGSGNGPTSAFFIENSRVIFNQIQFQGFTAPAVYGIDADVEFVSCAFTNNVQAAGFMEGSSVIVDQGTLNMSSGQTGFVMAQSTLVVSGVTLVTTAGDTPGPYFIAESGSNMTLQTHTPALETNITATMVIAQAELNSSIVVSDDFTSNGAAAAETNSIISLSVSASPFSGGITTDSSSTTVTTL